MKTEVACRRILGSIFTIPTIVHIPIPIAEEMSLTLCELLDRAGKKTFDSSLTLWPGVKKDVKLYYA